MALRRSEPNYFVHLLHRGTSEGRIALNFTPSSSARSSSSVDMVITPRGPRATPLLDKQHARFFSERCYLAQSTLGRLLEIYQHSEVGDNESPLTKFVKDVLGLDQLDAVIDGLTAAEDIRRIRKLVPGFREVEEARGAAQASLAQSEAVTRQLSGQAEALLVKVREGLSGLPGGRDIPSVKSLDPTSVERVLSSNFEESKLVALSRSERDLISLRDDWAVVAATPEAADIAKAEVEERASRKALENWRNAVGQRLEDVIDRLRDIFPDLPSLASTDPKTALQSALDRVSKELRRCNQLIEEDDRARYCTRDIGAVS